MLISQQRKHIFKLSSDLRFLELRPQRLNESLKKEGVEIVLSIISERDSEIYAKAVIIPDQANVVQ